MNDSISGIGTHFIPSHRMPSLMNRLSELETDELDVVNACIDEFAGILFWRLNADFYQVMYPSKNLKIGLLEGKLEMPLIGIFLISTCLNF